MGATPTGIPPRSPSLRLVQGSSCGPVHNCSEESVVQVRDHSLARVCSDTAIPTKLTPAQLATLRMAFGAVIAHSELPPSLKEDSHFVDCCFEACLPRPDDSSAVRAAKARATEQILVTAFRTDY